MDDRRASKRSLIPILTPTLALAVLAAPFFPALFPFVLVGGVSAVCALALARRRSPALKVAVAGAPAWLAAGLAGAWVLADRSVGGLAWILLALFLLPLPLFPWLYARTFADGDTAAPAPPVPDPDPGSRTPDPGREGGP
jgi:hypothetical protein